MNKQLPGLCGLNSLWLGFIFLAVSGPVQGQSVRVLSWNAQSLTNSAEVTSSLTARINSAALWLGEYQADVVLLQELPDRQTAHLMAAKLGPGYSMAVCSALPGKVERDPAAGQVAIISRFPVVLSWAGAWDPVQNLTVAGGFAFALLRHGDEFLSLYSVLVPKSPEAVSLRVEAMQQVLRQIDMTADWKTNRPVAHIVGGTLNMQKLETSTSGETISYDTWPAGFKSAYFDLPLEQRQTRRGRLPEQGQVVDDLFVDYGGFVTPARTLWGISSAHAAVVGDWDLSSVEVASLVESLDASVPLTQKTAEALPIKVVDIPPTPVPAPVLTIPPPPDPEYLDLQLFGLSLKWWVAGLLIGTLLLCLLILRRTSRRTLLAKGLLPLPEDMNVGTLQNYPVRVDQVPRQVHPTLLAWLKEKFIGGLLTQRQEMIRSHNDASVRADKIGQRVVKLQEVLMKRIRQSEERVNELEQDLAEAQAENRELIQVNLMLAQRELEEARKKAGVKA